ncbi:hypothetical protein T492DRAFT_960676 [Pavlovales sp. CCMP2436]|nr:hypothetical protein T492DRAFT_960676 [Pavlovales sp. CCMP2436]|mmetsp:Transcript_6563/g.17044  ORF Transcript_6563/g.17044 Transcript_6563/m.17044 type:complete len:386 (+) Transcript_6563:63-1220(+)
MGAADRALLLAALASVSAVGQTRLLVGGHSDATLTYEEFEAPRLTPGSPEATAHLRAHGYVVLAGVLNATELQMARELQWEFMEGSGKGIRRAEPTTWHRIKTNQYGIVWGSGAGQSAFMWYIRSAPRLVGAFAALWGIDSLELLTSFEGIGMFPPVELEASWGSPLAEGWFHTDQNGLSRPGLWTLQSFTSLFDQDATTGAFVVVPGSHLGHRGVTKRALAEAPGTPRSQQFLMVSPDDPVLTASPPRLIRCKAGDSVVWDSRTVHCNTPGGAQRLSTVTEAPKPELRRVAAYVSMAPRYRATEQTILLRKRAVLLSQSCTHWPFEATCVPPERAPPRPPELSALQLSLAGLTAEDGLVIAEARKLYGTGRSSQRLHDDTELRL